MNRHGSPSLQRTVSHTSHTARQSTHWPGGAQLWHMHVHQSKTQSICGSKHGGGDWWIDPRAGWCRGWWRCGRWPRIELMRVSESAGWGISGGRESGESTPRYGLFVVDHPSRRKALETPNSLIRLTIDHLTYVRWKRCEGLPWEREEYVLGACAGMLAYQCASCVGGVRHREKMRVKNLLSGSEAHVCMDRTVLLKPFSCNAVGSCGERAGDRHRSRHDPNSARPYHPSPPAPLQPFGVVGRSPKPRRQHLARGLRATLPTATILVRVGKIAIFLIKLLLPPLLLLGLYLRFINK